jgi:hypothetical protein
MRFRLYSTGRPGWRSFGRTARLTVTVSSARRPIADLLREFVETFRDRIPSQH